MNVNNFDVLNVDSVVLGSGIAGLLTAKLLAKNDKNVLLATDNFLCSGASYFNLKATLGIQTCDNSEESKEQYKEDIYNTAGDIVDSRIVDTFVNNCHNCQEILREIGFEPRLREDKRPACFAKYSRPIYLINDWNKACERLIDIFEEYKNITVMENTKAVKILKGSENECVGVLLIRDDKYTIAFSNSVVIATGGLASLYKNNLYPKGVDGSGLLIAKEAGAEVRHTQFIQFIPGLLTPKYKTLFGEHTLKYVDDVLDSNNNSIFPDYSQKEKKELFLKRSAYAPFSVDYDAKEFDFRMANAIINGSDGVRLLYNKEIYNDKEDFLVTYVSWLKNTMGIDLVNDNITIDHFAHSCNGGIAIDENCNTNIQYLYAIGEVANTVEGVNRLGGNCIASICVFTPRLVENILNNTETARVSNEKKNYAYKDLEKYFEDIEKNNGDNTITETELVDSIANTLTKHALVIRSKEGLNEALDILNNLQAKYSLYDNHNINSLSAYMSIKSAKLLVEECLACDKSVGANYRYISPNSL